MVRRDERATGCAQLDAAYLGGVGRSSSGAPERVSDGQHAGDTAMRPSNWADPAGRCRGVGVRRRRVSATGYARVVIRTSDTALASALTLVVTGVTDRSTGSHG
jgi:hypothetical protein